MPFTRIPGVVGKVYVPESRPNHLKKHPCHHCYACQMCGDDRCRVCRNGSGRTRDPVSGPREKTRRCRLKS